MVASIPPKAPPSADDLMAQLAAARGEVAEAAARSRALRKQMQAESLALAALVAGGRGDGAQPPALAAALADDADTARRQGVDIKA